MITYPKLTYLKCNLSIDEYRNVTQYLKLVYVIPKLIEQLESYIMRHSIEKDRDTQSSVALAATLLSEIEHPRPISEITITTFEKISKFIRQHDEIPHVMTLSVLSARNLIPVRYDRVLSHYVPRIRRKHLISLFDEWSRGIDEDTIEKYLSGTSDASQMAGIVLTMAFDGYDCFSYTFKHFCRFQVNHVFLEKLTNIAFTKPQEYSNDNGERASRSLAVSALYNYIQDHPHIKRGLLRYAIEHSLIFDTVTE